jgi:isopentenyl diphosphate isomerase/L-lactate dehydrogenase-like FMN-dependent dehydrogenase
MKPVNLLEYEDAARDKLPQPIFDFIAGAAEDEITLRRNREAYQRIQLRPRVLVDVSSVDTSTEILGSAVSLPVLLAPVALHRAAHPDGELATARAAADAGAIMVLSTMASSTIEEVAEAAAGPKWFQLYVNPDRELTERLVRRAEASGYSALCLTVDAPYLGRRERDFHNRLKFPPDVRYANLELGVELSGIALGDQESALAAAAVRLINPAMTWRDIDWLRSLTSLPLLIKGILTTEDACLAVDHGVAGIVVSNHGGRQLDTVPATIEVLPEIVEAVQGRAGVFLDGGIRRGTDVLKALALGATAVLIGRPYIWGLAVDGEAGVRRVLELLKAEFELAMALTGCAVVSDIDRNLVRL